MLLLQFLAQVINLGQVGFRLILQLLHEALLVLEMALDGDLLALQVARDLLLGVKLARERLLELHARVGHLGELSVQFLNLSISLGVGIVEGAVGFGQLSEALLLLLNLLVQLVGLLLLGKCSVLILSTELFDIFLEHLDLLVSLSDLGLCHLQLLGQLIFLMLLFGRKFIGDIIDMALILSLLFLERQLS